MKPTAERGRYGYEEVVLAREATGRGEAVLCEALAVLGHMGCHLRLAA